MYEDESALIAALIQKREDAFRTAIKRYQSAMLHLANSIAGEKIGDEVVQEAWFSVIKALPRFEGRSSLKTWILKIVANEAKSRLRRENRSTSRYPSLRAMTSWIASITVVTGLRGKHLRHGAPTLRMSY